MRPYLAEARELPLRKRLWQMSTALTWAVVPAISFGVCVFDAQLVVRVSNDVERLKHCRFEIRVVAVRILKFVELRFHLLLFLNVRQRGSVGFKFTLQPLLNRVFDVLLQGLVVLALLLGVVEVICRRVGHLWPRVRLDAELVLSEQCYSGREVSDLPCQGVIRLCGWLRRRRRIPLRFLPLYRAILELPTTAVAVVYPLRRDFGLLGLLGECPEPCLMYPCALSWRLIDAADKA